MSHPFPPNRPESSELLYTMISFGILTIISAGLVIRFWRRPKPGHVYSFGTVAALAIGYYMACSTGLPSRYRHGYGQDLLLAVQVVLICCSIGLLRVIVVSIRNRTATPARWAVVAAIPVALYGSMVVFSMYRTLTAPRGAARSSSCRLNLKVIGLGLHAWHDHNGEFPPATVALGDNPPMSWRVAILPAIDEQAAYRRYDAGRVWDAPDNLQLARSPIVAYRCPANPAPFEVDSAGLPRFYTAYVAPRGDGTSFPEGRALTIRDFADGTAGTLMVVESCGSRIVWTEPRDVAVTAQSLGINLPGDERGSSSALISSYHDGTAHVVLADGSVRIMPATIDRTVLSAMLTVAGNDGDDVTLPW